jgi:hypothetical protein
MKLPVLVLVIALALIGCNQTDTTKQEIRDNTTNNVSDVSNKTNNGKAVGQDYGGKGTGYGQVKKIPPGQAVPPLVEAPVHETPNIEDTPPSKEDLLAISVSELTWWEVKNVEVM